MSGKALLVALALLLASAASASQIWLKPVGRAEAGKTAGVETGPGAYLARGPVLETKLQSEPPRQPRGWTEEWWLHADYEDHWRGNPFWENTAAALQFVNDCYHQVMVKAIRYNFFYPDRVMLGHVWDDDGTGQPKWYDDLHWNALRDFDLYDYPTRLDWRYDLSQPYPEFGLGEYFWVGWQVKDWDQGNFSGWNFAGDTTGQPYWSWWWDTNDWVRIFQAYGYRGDFTMEVLVEPIPSFGLVTGGGWIPGDQPGPGNKRTFGFNVHSEAGAVWGQLQFNDHGTKMKVHSDTIKTLVVHGDTVADFSGDCRVDGMSEYSFDCQVEDRGEPGHGVDRFSIDISGPGGFSYSADDFLGGGNIQIHTSPGRGFDKGKLVKGGSEPEEEPGDDPNSPPNMVYGEEVLPMSPALWQNSPNPFTDRTTISFQLPASGSATLEIYDMTGRPVATLVDGKLSAGAHSVTWERDGTPSGIYFCRLVAGNSIATKKLIVLR